MLKSCFHDTVFPKSTEHFILLPHCLILPLFASLLIFVIFLVVVQFLMDTYSFDYSEQQLPSGKGSIKTPCDPSMWGGWHHRTSSPGPQSLAHGWAHDPSWTNHGSSLQNVSLGKKRKINWEKRGLFFPCSMKLLAWLEVQSYQRPSVTPWRSPPATEEEAHPRREIGWEVGGSWELSNSWFQELKSQRFSVSWPPKA